MAKLAGCRVTCDYIFLKNQQNKLNWSECLCPVKASFRKKVHRLLLVNVLIYSLSKEGSENVTWSVNFNVLEAQNLYHWESELWPHLVSFFFVNFAEIYQILYVLVEISELMSGNAIADSKSCCWKSKKSLLHFYQW